MTAFRIIKSLGTGSIGKVYLVEQDGQLFAFKSLTNCDDPKQRARVRDEIEVTSKLNHANIVRTISLVDHGRDFGYLMEYVEGGELSVLIANQAKIHLSTALKICIQIATGLEYLQSQSIVHRDLKPQNILLTKEQNAKIADFGLARLGIANTLSQPGFLFGTAAYVSPEFVELGDCDHRADIFALGVIAFELINRKLPWRGTTIVDVIKNRNSGQLEGFEKGVPVKLQQVVTKALACSIYERYQSAGELKSEFEACVNELPPAGFFERLGWKR